MSLSDWLHAFTMFLLMQMKQHLNVDVSWVQRGHCVHIQMWFIIHGGTRLVLSLFLPVRGVRTQRFTVFWRTTVFI